jgi:hypothetical protein
MTIRGQLLYNFSEFLSHSKATSIKNSIAKLLEYTIAHNGMRTVTIMRKSFMIDK